MVDAVTVADQSRDTDDTALDKLEGLISFILLSRDIPVKLHDDHINKSAGNAIKTCSYLTPEL